MQTKTDGVVKIGYNREKITKCEVKHLSCERCGKENGIIYVTRLTDGVLREVQLCEVCFREESQVEVSEVQSANHMLSALLDAVSQSPLQVGWIKTTSCSRCGMTYGLFREMGKMGCSECYHTFNSRIETALQNWHGHKVHRGKSPRLNAAAQSLKAKRQAMQELLAKAIREENFEEAARLRDLLLTLGDSKSEAEVADEK